MQEVPLPENPSLHSQVYKPIKFSHLAFVLQGLEIHSLMSKIFNKISIKIAMFSGDVHKYMHHCRLYILSDFSKTIWTVDMCFSKDHQLLCRLPVQEVPSPVNPLLHLHVYKLIPSIHSAFLSQISEIHSSMSKIFININFNSEIYMKLRISEHFATTSAANGTYTRLYVHI